ncbi:MAG: dephospho-CoA kinase [Pseudomonadota bacterium]
MRRFVVGLTGGVASGKTLASNRFARHGVSVVDTDLLARDIVEPGQPALADIAERFGPAVIGDGGRLNRRVLRERVFADPRERQALEAITHPRIRARAVEQIAATTGLYCVLVVPLLVESPLRDDVDRILVIDCPIALQRERLMARDNVDAKLADAMLAAQISREERRRAADDLVVNDRSPEKLEREIDALHHFYSLLAAL